MKDRESGSDAARRAEKLNQLATFYATALVALLGPSVLHLIATGEERVGVGGRVSRMHSLDNPRDERDLESGASWIR